jgi:hypothetical protein
LPEDCPACLRHECHDAYGGRYEADQSRRLSRPSEQ